MTRILVTCAGGRLAVAFTRALTNLPDQYEVIGVDADVYGLQRAATCAGYVVPRASDHNYIDALNAVIDQHGIEMVFVQLEAELLPISAKRHLLHAPVFLPRHETMLVCDSKFASYEKWQAAGIPVPESIKINSKQDLESALEHLGGNMWLRSMSGAGGKGSLPIRNGDIEKAMNWVEMWKGWGNFMAAELLTEQTSSWESVWNHGKLVAAQVRKRIRWEFSSMTMSGVTGITGVSETEDNVAVQNICHDAVLAVDPEPHGIMGVDVSIDSTGNPKVTEINAGRFMSGGAILFAQQGFNFPYVATKTAFGESVDGVDGAINPLPNGLVCVRGLDIEPIITTRAAINALEKGYKAQKASLDMAV